MRRLGAAIRPAAVNDELDVHHPPDPQGQADAGGVVDYRVDFRLGQVQARVNGHGVAAVYAGPFHMLHDPRNQDSLAVADGVNLAFLAFHVAVDQHRLVGRQLGGGGEVAYELGGILHDLHGAPAQDVAGPDDGGVADGLGHLERLADSRHRRAGGLRNPQAGEKVLELVPVGSDVDGLRAGPQDGHTGHGKGLGQVYRRLAAELHQGGGRRNVSVLAVSRFVVDDVADRLLIQWLKVQAVAGIEVGGHRLGVGVDHDAADSGLRQGDGGVNAAIVEFDALPYAYGAAAYDQRLLPLQGRRLVLLVVGAVIVGGDRVELGGAGIDRLVDRAEPPLAAEVAHLFRQHIGESPHLGVGEAEALGLMQEVGSELLRQQAPLHLHYPLQRDKKPRLEQGALHQLVYGLTPPQGGHDGPQALVVGTQRQIVYGPAPAGAPGGILPQEGAPAQLQRPRPLLHGGLEGAVYHHHLARGLHLGRGAPVPVGELVEGPAGDLDDAVVEGRLEGGLGAPGYGVVDLVQTAPYGDLGRDAGDGIPGRLAGQAELRLTLGLTSMT